MSKYWRYNQGYIPCPVDVLVEIQLRRGISMPVRTADHWDWSLDITRPNEGDIIKWRKYNE